MSKLSKINNFFEKFPEHIDTFFLIAEIIEKSYTKNDLRYDNNDESVKQILSEHKYNMNNINENIVNILNAINAQKVSVMKGKQAEDEYTELIQKTFMGYNIVRTSNQSNYCDIEITDKDGFKVLVEIKNYTKNVNKDQIDKFHRDLHDNNCSGIMISQNSGISFRTDFQIDKIGNHYAIYLVYNDKNVSKILSAFLNLKNINDTLINPEKYDSLKIQKQLDDLKKELETNIDNQHTLSKLVDTFYRNYKNKMTVTKSYSYTKQNIETSSDILVSEEINDIEYNGLDVYIVSCNYCAKQIKGQEGMRKHKTKCTNIPRHEKTWYTELGYEKADVDYCKVCNKAVKRHVASKRSHMKKEHNVSEDDVFFEIPNYF